MHETNKSFIFKNFPERIYEIIKCSCTKGRPGVRKCIKTESKDIQIIQNINKRGTGIWFYKRGPDQRGTQVNHNVIISFCNILRVSSII